MDEWWETPARGCRRRSDRASTAAVSFGKEIRSPWLHARRGEKTPPLMSVRQSPPLVRHTCGGE